MFKFSQRSQAVQTELNQFMQDHIYPNENAFKQQLENAADRWAVLPLIEELKLKAKDAGLWNLFIPPEHTKHCEYACRHGGFTNFEYAPMAEIMGRVFWAPEVFNCSAPDTGNMEVLMKYGNRAQQKEWLTPLLGGEIRSGFAMTEPGVASSDATNVELSICRDGDDYLLNGRKWFISGAMHERTRVFIVMGKSDPDNPDLHIQQSQILVPKDTPGLEMVRPLTTLGFDDAPMGHAEINFSNVRVPATNILLGEGRGFEIAQGRLGPGRVHHCMRLIGAAQRSLELACQRATSRTAFGQLLAENQSVREDIANSFAEIEMARLLVLKTADKMDELGALASRDMIAAAKIKVPVMVQTIIDRCMQMHGAGGLTGDYAMAEAFNYARWARLADGPDQVHQMALGRAMIKRFANAAEDA